jgi:inorganic triphosphatase YgiF
MTVETELKLRISPEHMARLKRHPFLRSLAATRATTRKLHSIYYDTPDLYLHKHAMALRLRRVGRQWLQTLKGGGAVQAGLHQRNEWECVVAGEALDFAALEASGGMHLPRHVRNELQPVFITEFSRTARMVNFAGADIELSMDSGEIRACGKMHAISELELELKSGESLQLFCLALLLLDIVPLEIEAISKAEYGYRLWAHAPNAVSRAVVPAVENDSDVAVVLQKMIWSCLQSLQANVAGAANKLNDEYLHQMRVALRRLRVVLGMAAKVHADAELEKLRGDFSALAVELGHAREWDVFVTQTLLPLRQQLSAQVDIEPLLHSSEQERRKHHEWVRKIIQSQDFQRLLLRFGVWMQGAYWRADCWHEPLAGQSLLLRHFSGLTLQRLGKQVRKRYDLSLAGESFASHADIAQLHRLRIACKKLRYSAELFASLYADEKIGRYLAALGKMQDTLGTLNDIAVARRLLDQLGAGSQHEASLVIRGWVEHDYAQHLAELHKAWKKFSERKAFWD